MKLNIKKSVIVLMVTTMLGGVVIPSASVFASEKSQNEHFSDDVNIEFDKNGNAIFSDAQIAVLNESKESAPQARVGGKKAAVTIAKWILKNRQKLTNVVGSTLGRSSAVKFGNALKHMEGPLRKITSANKQGMKAIENIIYSGLKASGMSTSAAKNLAAGIRGILDWII